MNFYSTLFNLEISVTSEWITSKDPILLLVTSEWITSKDPSHK